MAFNSFSYVFFLAAVVLLYYQCAPRYRTWILLVASWIFYGAYNIWFVWLLAFTTLFNFYIGLRIGSASESRRRLWLQAGIATDLGILCFYKYPNFIAGSATGIAAWLGLPLPPLAVEIVLPLGISFYTFEAISYLVDVHRRELRCVRSLPEFALFLSFFPHLVAGPIIRAPELIEQLTGHTEAEHPDARRGLALFLYGLIKKVFLADVMASFVNEIYAAPERLSGLSLAAATYAFAVQIYCDFSGYSDMAIGSALLFGIKLPDNFRSPYLSLSIREFWNRWHITLSRWLRNYLYIPLGGNRHGRFRTHLNLIITMLLGGLWHGAGWNWVVWGGIQGVAMSLERLLGLDEAPSAKLARFVRWFMTFNITCISWVFFRSASCAQAWQVLRRIATLAPGEAFAEQRLVIYTGCGLAVMFAAELCGLRERWQEWFHARPAVARWAAYAALLLMVLTFTRASHPEFIYFAF